MEGLFELITESPLLLFFIIAAIISFFRSRGGEQQEKQSGEPSQERQSSQPKQQTRKQGSPDIGVDWKDIFRQETDPTERQPSASRQSRSESPVSSFPNDAEEELNQSNRELHERYERIKNQKESTIETSPIFNNDLTLQKKDKINLDFSQVSKNDAIKGVIWSEILGKPKARRK
ncbi:hypothetical protein ACM26V_24205 [Salipaludibacillus sp. HK11]|uniref:hypothetical protein n=1 Tax=Salipaludibacillus sp. HK11 TaxID=3394320 RepID=UPI0039FCCB06